MLCSSKYGRPKSRSPDRCAESSRVKKDIHW